ncbi:hypothetical protein [Sediminibacterium sp.]|jgi:hypothetical protein|uniref:hypothetical protein n=1 Tax=Sediminibacterium sp. TaxID=1917865 RepID=UPI000CA95DA9|nr:hypothetical protein [Sediminibacterium sp.]PJE46193.1 MAG: hypothetical protein CUR34_11125 [Sediminibacterium sp.] [Sediminibacterium sp. FEMGT703S]
MKKNISLYELNLTSLDICEMISIEGGADSDSVGKQIGKGIGWFAGQVVNGIEWWRENFKQPPELIGVK